MFQGFPSKLPSPNSQQQQSVFQGQSNQQFDQGGKIPTISAESRAQYANVFYKLGASDTSKMPGNVARPVFQKSGLPNDDLAKVWMLADIDKDGHLDREEFSLAMHLIYAVKSGIILPPILPKHLVPEAKIIHYQTMATNQADWQSFAQIAVPLGANQQGVPIQLQLNQNQQFIPQQQQQQPQFYSQDSFVPAPFVPKSTPGGAISFEQRIALSNDLDAALNKRNNRF
eukprot:gene12602-14789_t